MYVDHYSPREKVLRLSDTVYNSTSVAAIGVAAHECGHAIQHKVGYMSLKLRSLSVPVANIGSALVTLVGCGKVDKKVTCTMCNGSGQVKYYYGEGDNDYNMGPCTSCDEKGYTIVTVDSKDASKEVCGSCNKTVERLVTKKDAVGEDRTWCKNKKILQIMI